MTPQAASSAQARLDELCINTIRMLAVDAVQAANSGHPGTPMGAAPLAYLLYTRILRHNPSDPRWPNRDRFVLSAGHASMLLYGILHLSGYDLSLEELKRFRQLGSLTPGHPENIHTPGVEATTGPLGQGFANGVGMAIAERHLAARFNRPGHEIVDHYVYALVSDGDLMEGVAAEAASLAGHLKLGRLIYVYDDNKISIEGSTDLAFTEDVGKRFEAYGWHVLHVDGNDLEALEAAIRAAQAETERPSLIVQRTVIGFGSPNRAGTAKIHGEALGADEVALTRRNLGWEYEPFQIPDEALAHFRASIARGEQQQSEWRTQLDAYARAYPNEAAQLSGQLGGDLPEGWDADLPTFSAADGSIATRVASSKVLNAFGPRLPAFIGGSADLAPSTGTAMKGLGDFGPGSYEGRNMHFGVREHAMGSVAVGMALHGGVIPFTATFLIFSDYMRPPMRLASLSHQRVIFVFTHDSIGLGEDGPTHQSVEQLAGLRAIPGSVLIRPADANETREAWRVALQRAEGPTILVLTRQGLPVYDRSIMGPAEDLARGAYVLVEAEGDAPPDAILIGTGSEVEIAVKARELLAADGIRARVVSMPSWELFNLQSDEYREQVLPAAVRARVSVEAGSTVGWSDYVGSRENALGVDRFGASAPYKQIYSQYGLTAEHLAQMARQAIQRS